MIKRLANVLVASIFLFGGLCSPALAKQHKGNGIPDSVDLVCAWTWMCSYQNIHPNEIGYEIIAQAFYDVLLEIPISKPPRNRIVKHGNR